MKKTLVTVAQRAKARFFRAEEGGRRLFEIEDLVHPEARLHEGDLVTDSPGAVKDRSGPQLREYGEEKQAKKHEASVFAKEVAAAMKRLRTDEHYQRMILVAEPGFLGLLRAELDAPTAQMVAAELDKELTELDTEEIADRLSDLVRS